MAFDIPVTRRTFLKVMGSGALVAISISNLPAAVLMNSSMQTEPDNGPPWAPEPGKARWRIDGIPKVTGQKIYARDFKASDFVGWPKQENWLYALRCNRVDRVYEGYDLSMLPAELQPLAIVDTDALLARNIPLAPEADPIASQDIYWLARKGHAADCYGQPAAMLIFANFDVYRRARKLLDFNDNAIRYGAPVPPEDRPKPVPFTPTTTYVRDDDTDFNYVKDYQVGSDGKPTPAYLAALEKARGNIDATIQRNADQGTWFKAGASNPQGFMTPAMDPVFMEPESGLAWYDAASGQLRLVLGTQSASEDAQSAVSLFTGSLVNLNAVHIVACYPGGGFGGRDRSYFPLYLSLAAPFAQAPLRWQQSRYEQFQVGLKRCETQFTESLWFNRQGKIQALKCDFTMNGGGKKNLSPYVAQLAALSAMSCYEIPRADATASSLYTPEVFGGSQRGFGGPQAFIAIETLLDEAAAELHMSPFAIRRANLLGSAPSLGRGRAITGAPILFDLQLNGVLDSLEQHPLWQERETTRAQREAQGLKYGVGLAMSNEAFGTSGDGMYGMVQVMPDGSLRVITTYTDMGNGAATTLGLAPSEYLGQNAQTIAMSVYEPFKSLHLTATSNPQKQTDVRYGSGSSSACLGAFHQYHAVKGAGQALLLESVLPAAQSLWRENVKAADVKWVDGALVARGIDKPLAWNDLLQQMRNLNLPTVAAVHASYAGSFWTGTYPFRSGAAEIEYDYVAVGTNPDSLSPLLRDLHPPVVDGAKFQRTTYAPSAALLALSVDPSNGRVKVEHVASAVSVGRQLCPDLVEGQSQGAVAMGLGNVLTETCPLGNDGPGNGRWNLNRYLLTRLPDIPVQTLIALPPPNDDPNNARGIAEAVMCPIAPALLNALAMATGHRFRETPVTPDQLRRALQWAA
ncbi:xanthine dehydrogenase family protein molybdopterin-binding subunit [Paraburkholderia antibiotica]|uniref:Xanthine dehydrogenase family protein molybdopterin-binding subunit n=1 Tax=Paraburkholderia antibiotica TaxID=2728839 RepID=A0A7Y0A2B6_9BURK|nr:molybdopterin cofactor-binding domain-containing protein [Paraburkholderia antibiotica]NML35235.1 xanthine dehydrogenase family protein molybdopterin-binding subunit [Paraburkholderia antibiotica]